MSEWLLILGTKIKPCQRQTHCIVRDGQRTGKGSQCGSFPGGNSKTVRKVAEGARAVGTGTCPVGSGNKPTTKQHSLLYYDGLRGAREGGTELYPIPRTKSKLRRCLCEVSA